MKKYILLLLALTTGSQLLFSQGLPEHKFRISFEPQYMVVNGLKFSVDVRLKNQKDWLVISPVIYYKDYDASYTSENDDMYYNEIGIITTRNIKKVRGYGLSLDNRVLLTDPVQNKFFGVFLAPYFTYGATFNQFQISHLEEGWITVPQNGVNYMEWGVDQKKRDITKVGLNFTIGVQTEIIEDLVVDFYLGCGIRYSIYNGDLKFNKSTMDYGFKGVMLLGGLRLGVGL